MERVSDSMILDDDEEGERTFTRASGEPFVSQFLVCTTIVAVGVTGKQFKSRTIKRLLEMEWPESVCVQIIQVGALFHARARSHTVVPDS